MYEDDRLWGKSERNKVNSKSNTDCQKLIVTKRGDDNRLHFSYLCLHTYLYSLLIFYL